eukprot:g3124.t1
MTSTPFSRLTRKEDYLCNPQTACALQCGQLAALHQLSARPSGRSLQIQQVLFHPLCSISYHRMVAPQSC